MKDDNGAFAAYMDRTWVNWRRELNGAMCERVRLAFLAGADAERKEREAMKCEESKSARVEAFTAKLGTSTRKQPSKALATRKTKRNK